LLPPEKQVDCECASGLARPVFHDHTGRNTRVTACLACGRVCVTESRVIEPHPHDVQCVGNEVMPVSAETLAWLATWPRRIHEPWGGREWLFAAAAARFATEGEIAAAARDAALEQQPMTRRERLLRNGLPSEPAPASLPKSLQTYRDVHDGAMLPDASLDAVFDRLPLNGWARAVYDDQLAAWPGLPTALERHMSDPERAASAFRYAADRRVVSPGILDRLASALAGIEEQNDMAHAALHLAGALGPQAAPVLAELEAALRRVDQNRDYYFHKSIAETITRCRDRGKK
jgi:hypothetical protein